MKKAKTVEKDDVRDRIIKSALNILNEGGREALTTRSVSEAADVQAPTIYRHFGDMRGLLDAIAEYGIVAAFKKKKEYKLGPDPVEDLRKLWEQHTNFGLENPAMYSLIFGEPRPGHISPAAEQAKRLMSELIERIAREGRLTVTEKRAAELVQAASSGSTLHLLNLPKEHRDLDLARNTCEAVIAAIVSDTPKKKMKSTESYAIALKASLPNVKSLTSGEKHLLKELLERISTHG